MALMTGKCLVGLRAAARKELRVVTSTTSTPVLTPTSISSSHDGNTEGFCRAMGCVPAPPPSLASHGQIPGLMGEGPWAASLPLWKWDSEPANQGWGMPGEGVARRPRGLVVRNRLWVQGGLSRFPAVWLWVGHLTSLCHCSLVCRLKRFSGGRWQGLMVPGGCCSQLVLCSVRGANFSRKGIPGTPQRANSVCELVDTSA